MNKQQMEVPPALYDDEVVSFIADRYRTTPQKVMRLFFVQEGLISDPEEGETAFRLENNEMEILRGMVYSSHL